MAADGNLQRPDKQETFSYTPGRPGCRWASGHYSSPPSGALQLSWILGGLFVAPSRTYVSGDKPGLPGMDDVADDR